MAGHWEAHVQYEPVWNKMAIYLTQEVGGRFYTLDPIEFARTDVTTLAENALPVPTLRLAEADFKGLIIALVHAAEERGLSFETDGASRELRAARAHLADMRRMVLRDVPPLKD